MPDEITEVHDCVHSLKAGVPMQQNVSPSKPVPAVTVQTPTRLTPEQLRKVSGAGLQQSSLPYGSW